MARHKISTPECKAESEKYRRTMIEKYGADGVRKHYQIIGRKGGENGRGPNYTGGFASNVEKAKLAGSKGGRRSRRGLRYIGEDNGFYVYKDENGGEVRYSK